MMISSISVLIFFFILYTLSFIEENQDPISFENGSYLTVTGKVKAVTPIIDKKFKVNVKTEDDSIWLITVLLENTSTEHPKILPSSSCQFSGLSFDIEKTTNKGQFNYSNYLKNQHITNTLFVSDPSTIFCDNSKNAPISIVHNWRFSALQHVRENFSESTSSWMAALIFGEDGWLNEDVKELFQKWGLSHLLALSGLHVGYLLFFLFSVSLYFLKISKEKTRIWIGLFLPVYGILAGWAAPIQRAVGMAEIGLVGWRWRKKWQLIDVLCFFFLILLLISPNTIYSIGFQFSYLVTFFLLLSRKLFVGVSKINLLCRISLISQLSLLPFQIHYFYTINPLSVFANMWMIPLFTLIILPFLFLMYLTSYIFNFYFLDTFFEWIMENVIYLLKVMDHFYQVEWVIGEIPISSIILFYLFLFGFLCAWEKGHNWIAILFCLAFTGVLMVSSALPYLSSEGTVTILDVGQGDTSVIELPYRKGIIIVDVKGDIEGSYSYDSIIKPFLKSKGITAIDAVIISHADLDHSGGLPFLINDFKVNQIITSPFSSTVSNYPSVMVTKATDVLSFKGTDFYFIHPSRKENNENDQSLVFTVKLGEKTWLFTGDISKEIEQRLNSLYTNLHVDVLKVSHHGSHTATSDDFLKNIKAKVAIISVGRKNSYGHPHPEVIDRLIKRDMMVLRTDRYGMITYTFHKTSGTFSTFLP